MGKLIVISGASGVGKGTVVKKMMARRKDLYFSVSATTRPPRPGEVDGKDYYFVTRERFQEMIRRGEMLEYDEHNMNFYGTPRAQVEEKRAKGHVLLDIEPVGARNVKNNYPEAELVFIMPPSVEELERRLRGRNDTPEDQIAIRMERAKWEMAQRTWYDHVVVNDDAGRCAEEILSLIEK
ncbi:guanylate kinase [Pseudoflavonifractor sp. MSJ-30]|uniref:guanylate kinase n=1 Tax=Pseudoflavonifractor sp. MSJ-30 TaxID=2841525 RepID=UPI001C110973|nr:guanylate kinase [Pseudoflavonifractor sp. MSJ-30]